MWHVKQTDERPLRPGVWKVNPNAPTSPPTYEERLRLALAYLRDRYSPTKEDEDEE